MKFVEILHVFSNYLNCCHVLKNRYYPVRRVFVSSSLFFPLLLFLY